MRKLTRSELEDLANGFNEEYDTRNCVVDPHYDTVINSELYADVHYEIWDEDVRLCSESVAGNLFYDKVEDCFHLNARPFND